MAEGRQLMRSRPRTISSICLSALAVNLLNGCSLKANDTGHAAVRIAANLPMSGSLGAYGQSIKDGAEMAQEDFQRTDPTGAGFCFDWQDNTGSPEQAVAIAKKHMNGEQDIYWSGMQPETAAVADQVEGRGLPQFVWQFDPTINKAIKGSEAVTNNFRTWVSLKMDPPVILNYAQAHKAKKLAIVYGQTAGAEEEYQHVLIPTLKDSGIKNLLVAKFDPNLSEYQATATKVQSFKPDLIILNGYPAELIALVRALRSLNLIENGNTICCCALLDTTQSLTNVELEGICVVAPMFAIRHDSARVKGWSERFRRKTNHWPLYTSAFAYDAISMIYEASRQMILPASSEQWVRALKATKLDGVTGPLAFDDDGSLVTPADIGVFKDGICVPLSPSK
jgi:branched-chain amino acid transport system substrate-binding protein